MKKIYGYNLLLLCFSLLMCKKPYEPPAITFNNNFLVVDGVINTYPGGETIITLSRTAPIGDTFSIRPELFARVAIQSDAGESYLLSQYDSGQYKSEALTLNAGRQYRLDIFTNDGNHYQSDFLTPIQTPEIDSLTWRRDKDVIVSINTHDPSNQTRYYRWAYDETWEYRAVFNIDLGVENRRIFYRDSVTQAYRCWQNAASTDILLGTSVRLSDDVISQVPLFHVPENSVKINFRYSVLVQQYGLTKEAYNYWQVLKKNTQELGTLFGSQPSQLEGNIHVVEGNAPVVIGYLSASSVTTKRLLIDNSELADWQGFPSGGSCEVIFTFIDPNDYLNFIYPDTTYAPLYFQTGGGLAVVKKACTDCTQYGGTNKKPSYWGR